MKGEGDVNGDNTITLKEVSDLYVTAGDKYRDASQSVVLANGQTLPLEGILQRLKGGVKVFSTPGDADIYLNDKNMGITPKVLTELNAADYTLTLKREGYKDYRQTLKIREGMLPNINVTLDEIMTKPPRRTTKPYTPIPKPIGKKRNRVWWYVGGTTIVTSVRGVEKTTNPPRKRPCASLLLLLRCKVKNLTR